MTIASAAWAADPAGGAAHDGHKVELLHWDVGAALWSIGVFVILLIILRIAAWKPILSGLNNREEYIRKTLADARHEREESQKLLAQYTTRIEQAKHDATAIVEEGRRDAEETRRRILADAQHEAEATIARAKKDIELARDDAMKRLHDQSIMLATAVAQKLIHRELSVQDHRALLDESLEQLQQAG